VAGTESYALATTFYSADHPSDFIDFSTTKAPWIDSVRLSRDGLAVVCAVDDEMCLGQMEHFKSLSSTRLTLSDVSKRFLGRRGRTFSFEVLLVRPGQTVRIPAADCCDGQPKGERNHSDPDAEGSSDFAALTRERLRSAKSESPAAGSLGEL
jgi:hypothetical protein